MITIQPDKVTLVYDCPVCSHTAEQNAESLVESGTGVCPDCDCDMLLDSVKVDSPQPITSTLTAINSKQDRAGNRYWALRWVDHATGKTVTGKVSGGESNISAIMRVWDKELDDWDRSIRFETQELGVREFDRLTNGMDYAGCRPEDLATFIRNKLEE